MSAAEPCLLTLGAAARGLLNGGHGFRQCERAGGDGAEFAHADGLFPGRREHGGERADFVGRAVFPGMEVGAPRRYEQRKE